ncbi:MAG: DUF1292 domain-containing protein [Clostridiales bacterium]|nr:DUF1292 domain-containing protein [Clostridiales bacterium]
MEFEEMNIVQLIDEDGEEMEFEHIMTIDYKEKQYIILATISEFEDDEESEDFDDDSELVILEIQQDENGDDVYASIEDDDLLDEVYDAYLQIVGDDIN